MTHDEYLRVPQAPDADPPLFSGKPKPRQVCECSKCGRVAVVICGKCDVKEPT